MDENTAKLLAQHRAEFERAKISEHNAWLAQGVVACIAVLALFSPIAWLTYLATVVALLVRAIRTYYNLTSKSHKARAEQGRRVLWLMEGLGYRPFTRDLLELSEALPADEAEIERWRDDAYYASAGEEPGCSKFRKILVESACWSKHLFEASAKQTWLYFSIALGGAAIVLFLLQLVPDSSTRVAVARTVSIGLVFLLSIDLFGRAASFQRATKAVDDVCNRVELLQPTDTVEADLLIVFADYNAAIQGAPLIPTRIYERNQEKLNRLCGN